MQFNMKEELNINCASMSNATLWARWAILHECLANAIGSLNNSFYLT